MVRLYPGLFLAFLLTTSTLPAQIVNDLERASDSDSRGSCDSGSSDDRSSSSDSDSGGSTWDDDDDYSSSSSDDGGSSGSYGSDSNFPAFYGPCAIFSAIGNGQRNMLDHRSEVRRMVSIETSAPVGLGMDGYFTFAPSIRGNWGMFSTGFRYFNLTEPGLEGRDRWITYDLEILQINVVQVKPVRLRWGSGITIEDYKGGVFQEFYAGLDFFMLDEKLALLNEGRISTDYCGCPAQRKEFNSSLQFRLLETQHFSLYNTYQFMYQNYYGAVSVWTGGGGIRMLLH